MGRQLSFAIMMEPPCERRVPRAAPKPRQPLDPETIMRRNARRLLNRRKKAMEKSVRRLLNRRIEQFHPDVMITKSCLTLLSFADRPLTEREHITVLAMCRCYGSEVQRLALLGYVGYLKTLESTDINLPAALDRFRLDPSARISVFESRYADPRTRYLSEKIAAPPKRPERPRRKADDEL